MKTKEELEKLQAGDLYLTETVSMLMSEISERDTALSEQKELFNQLRETWDNIDEYVRHHKEIKAFDSVSMTALKFIKERDGYKLESSKLQSKLEAMEKRNAELIETIDGIKEFISKQALKLNNTVK
jgi:hypothetical protein